LLSRFLHDLPRGRRRNNVAAAEPELFGVAAHRRGRVAGQEQDEQRSGAHAVWDAAAAQRIQLRLSEQLAARGVRRGERAQAAEELIEIVSAYTKRLNVLNSASASTSKARP
jgi:hypothetical protein